MLNPQTFVILFLIFDQGVKLCWCNRNISFTYNPKCKQETIDCDKPWIMYGKGEKENNTIHYLWSAMKVPSFIMVLSDPNSEININWENLQAEHSVTFTEGWSNIFGISFQNLILFNDEHDTGTLQNVTDSNKRIFSLSEFDWVMSKNENISTEEFVVEFSTVSSRHMPLSNDSKIYISLTSFEADGRSSSVPHLIGTQDSSYVEVVLDDLTLGFNETQFHFPRWALDTIILANDSAETTEQRKFIYESRHSLDDEHTPGVFELASISMPIGMKTVPSPYSGGYLQWRPVAYLSTSRTINQATYPNVNSSLPPQLDEKHFKQAKKSLMYSLVGESVKDLSTQTTIAFGEQGDGYYIAHNYTVWSFAMGLGEVPKESFSSTLVIIIFVGVGLPLILLVAGCIFLGVKKYQRRGEPLLGED